MSLTTKLKCDFLSNLLRQYETAIHFYIHCFVSDIVWWESKNRSKHFMSLATKLKCTLTCYQIYKSNMRQQFLSQLIAFCTWIRSLLSQILYSKNPTILRNVLFHWQQNWSMQWLATKFVETIWGGRFCPNSLFSVHTSDLYCPR